MRKALLFLSLLFAFGVLIVIALFFWFFVLGGCYPSYCSGGACTLDCGGFPPAITFIILGTLVVVDSILWLLFGYLYRKKNAWAKFMKIKILLTGVAIIMSASTVQAQAAFNFDLENLRSQDSFFTRAYDIVKAQSAWSRRSEGGWSVQGLFNSDWLTS